MQNSLETITARLTSEISESLSKCGLMFRIFSRVKSESSITHKLEVKYADRKVKIQDMIGVRVVVYFQDDVDALALYYSVGDVVKKSIDEFDSSTFRPQRLNITSRIPAEMTEEFLDAVPDRFRDCVEPTYEIQIRTVFSEGWHEVEHDLRYKCKEDWEGCEPYSRTLNGVIATLETAEWNMKALFADMARHNFRHSNYTAMLRNKFHLKFKSETLSENLSRYLNEHRNLAEDVLNADRLIVIYTMLTHKAEFTLTYDNLLFLINRIEMMDIGLMAMEPEDTRQMLNAFLNS
ncbi:MAG: GTP pyrophosphokinase [Bacteroidales bacterium]|nr:GTP pyrophosphokinase [Bacteroidales bacterium]